MLRAHAEAPAILARIRALESQMGEGGAKPSGPVLGK